jgi:hypothetical protein
LTTHDPKIKLPQPSNKRIANDATGVPAMLVMWVAIALLIFHVVSIPNALSFNAKSEPDQQPANQRWKQRTTGMSLYMILEVILAMLTFGAGLAGGYYRLGWLPAAAASVALVLLWLAFWATARPLAARKSLLAKPKY